MKEGIRVDMQDVWAVIRRGTGLFLSFFFGFDYS
jgi:hypothetical protein